ncbi:MAG: STAS domain-containing protein [Pseudomonadota bacterium]
MVIETKPVEMMIGNLLDEGLDIEPLVDKPLDNIRETTMTAAIHTINLEHDCTIYEVAEKHNQIMQQWAGQDCPIVLNMQAVTDIDVCFLQLLISCKKTAQKNNVSCQILNLPDEIIDKINDANLTEQLLEM